MIIIRNYSTNPYFNMAAEEYLLSIYNEPIIMLWQNDKAIIVGRNQNTISEINTGYCKINGIPVIRRLSGGGAVFHDLGNINYTVIEPQGENNFNNYKHFTKNLIDYLKLYGINATFSGRNDVLINGLKISGNAQCVKNNMVMHHGCILFSTDITKLSLALNVNKEKIMSKGITSVKSRVVNINEFLKKSITVEDFIDEFQSFLLKKYDIKRAISFTKAEIEKIKLLVGAKYSTYSWNYGQSPNYNYKSQRKYSFGIIEVCLNVECGYIKTVSITGDFFGEKDISVIEQLIIGQKHIKEEIYERLEKVKIHDYIAGCSLKKLIKLF